MKNNSRLTLSVLGLALGVLGLTSLPSKAAVTGSSVDNGDGTYTYAYTVDNVGGLFDVIALSLEFNFPEALIDWNPLDTFAGGDVAVPTSDWIAQLGIPTLGASAQDFLSIDPNGDVLIGSALSGFSFTSAHAPGDLTYFIFGATGDSDFGRTIGPYIIPEGSTLIASGFLALGCLSVGLRRRARSRGGQPPLQ